MPVHWIVVQARGGFSLVLAAMACGAPGDLPGGSASSEGLVSSEGSGAGSAGADESTSFGGQPPVVGPPLAFTDITAESADLMANPSVPVPGWGGVDMYAPGLALVDLDGDDVLDLVQPRANRSDSSVRDVSLFRGLGDGRFEQAATPAWSPASNPVGVLAFDYDGDDDLDVFLAVDGTSSVLLRNDGAFAFTDVSAAAGVALPGVRAYTAAAADVDGDDDLDLYVGAWNAGTLNEGTAPNVLLLNQGDGTFVDGTADAGVACNGWSTLGQAFADLDRDGDQDLYVANDFFHDCLYENQGDGTFVDVADDAGVAFGAKHAMGVAIADLDRDGWLDIVVTDDGGEDDARGNAVYLHRGDGGLRYEEVGVAMGLDGLDSSALTWNVCWGIGIVDFDLDADLDLHIATHGSRPELWWQVDDRGDFHPVVELQEPEQDARGSVYGDIDRDGDIDVLVGRRDAPIQILRNDTAGGHSLTVAPRPRAAAPGAEIIVTIGGREQVAIVQAGSSYMSTGPLEATFGLGDATTADRVSVRFADGTVRTVEAPSAGSRVVVARDP